MAEANVRFCLNTGSENHHKLPLIISKSQSIHHDQGKDKYLGVAESPILSRHVDLIARATFI